MKPLSIVVTLTAVVLVAAMGWLLGPGAAWWLTHVDGVTGLSGEKLAAAVDAVRGRALAVATGLAALAAVYYTARNADTARRTFQLGERGHDTDRYGKAVEQLGSDAAPVRLGGLYALEQLAENNPALRQRIVDVISAYLRMPYTPPRDEGQEGGGQGGPRTVPGGRSIASDAVTGGEPTASGATTGTGPAVTGAGPAVTGAGLTVAGAGEAFAGDVVSAGEAVPGGVMGGGGGRIHGRDPREERQVRLTAQRILTAHLRRPALVERRGWQRLPPPPDAFWPGIRLDLTAAALIGFDFATCRASEALFNEAAFYGTARFDGATFEGSASFGNAIFHDGASFVATGFDGSAWFRGATFRYGAGFGRAVFLNGADFSQVTLHGDAWFGEVVFHNAVSFQGAVLHGEAYFDGAAFNSLAWFGQVSQGRSVHLAGAFVTPQALGVEHQWPPGWLVERDGKGGGVLRQQVSTDTGAEQEAGPDLPA
ncbi:pentapeptide repeat-containing protein [Nonomuraea gerenzanensis]|uniref:Pentapeptide repeat family protein n=1 Tax=Nonomuraea gerenzanensis TaxID=93944 RepID=A0A1M4EMD7_9ACTN|nr:pentapeptide repeat-containing protein [Nonomuraea gerenzanensis]UBU11258.1 pentapeptide repeat-containing protein [Nonomuraea gerenzanensis]SBO99733.1 hypothetical protein BN4615_P9249 [Nonomuraea gerenzanensis]